MSISRIKQIKRILVESDVRDPRGTLIAIEAVFSQPKSKKVKKPAFKLVAERIDENHMHVAIMGDKLLAKHELNGLIETMRKHREVVFGPAKEQTSLEKIFAKLEADALKAAYTTEEKAK